MSKTSGSSGRNHRAHDKFITASKCGQLSVLRTLLRTNNLNFNHVDSSGKVALYYSVINQDIAMTTDLLDMGADVNHKSYVTYHIDNQLYTCYETVIVTAARIGNEALLQLLVSYGANVDSQTEIPRRDDFWCRDKSALHFTCEDNNVMAVKILLSEYADVNLEDRAGELAIHKTVRCRNCKTQAEILRLLCEHGSDVDWPSKMECSPLYLATFYGCYRKVNLLLSYAADVNKLCMRENSYGCPLHVAAAKDRMDLADLLISYGARLNIRNALNCSPLQLNINLLSRSDIVQYLIYHGAVVDGVDHWGYTVMAACIRNMRLDCESLAKLFVFTGYNLWVDQWLRPEELRCSVPLRLVSNRSTQYQQCTTNETYSTRYSDDQSESSDQQDENEEFQMPDIPIPAGRVKELCDWLLKKQCNPLRLVDACRITIRRNVQIAMEDRSIVGAIDSLYLPQQLKDFLLLRPWLNLPKITPKEKYSKD